MKVVRASSAVVAFGLVLSACSSSPTVSTCGSTGITAQVTGQSSVGLLSCNGLAEITPLPSFTLAVGSTLRVKGHGIESPDLTVSQASDIVSLDGATITARSSGQARLVASGVSCVSDRTGHQPTTCPLLDVTVP